MAYLTLKGINKIYPNGYHAMHDFNLEVERGEFIVFVGSSGCGKSTTLRMIAGLENISSGEFLIDGVRANEMSPRDRGIAMVFQSYALYPQMTVYDNLAFGLTLQGVDEDVIDEKVRNVAKILGLTDYLERVCHAAGKHAGIENGNGSLHNSVDLRLLEDEHQYARNNSADKELYAGKLNAVNNACKVVNHYYMERECNGAEQHQCISHRKAETLRHT